MLTVTINDTVVTNELARIAELADDLTPVMNRIRGEVFSPAIAPSWALSGLHSASGELRQAITAWSGKRSAGITLRTRKGRDLVLPKAMTHTKGRSKQAKAKKKILTIKGHSRGGRSVLGHERRNPGAPWGDIPARPFFPDDNILATAAGLIETMITEHIHAVSR